MTVETRTVFLGNLDAGDVVSIGTETYEIVAIVQHQYYARLRNIKTNRMTRMSIRTEAHPVTKEQA